MQGIQARRNLAIDYVPARITLLVLCGIVIQILPTIATLQLLINSLNLGLAILFPYDATAFGAYFFMTIAYSYFVSAVFPPRRLVSPVLIQFGAVFLTTIILIVAYVGLYAAQLQLYP